MVDVNKNGADHSLGGFDHIAPIYDRLAKLIFGQTLLTARQAHISHITRGNRVLILGGGTGEILPDLLQQIGEIGQILFVEASQQMILRAAARIRSHPLKDQVEFLWGTQESIPSGTRYDRIISNFFLDLFDLESLQEVFSRLHILLLPNGKWLIADFSLPTSRWRIPAQVLIAVMYLFFRLCCKIQGRRIQNFSALFSAQHYRELQKTSYHKGLIFSAVYQKVKCLLDDEFIFHITQ